MMVMKLILKTVKHVYQIQEKILNSDIIYVGGGDTVRMMEKWKGHKVDIYLKEAYNKGIIKITICLEYHFNYGITINSLFYICNLVT